MRDWPRRNQWRDAAANLQSELDAFEQRNVALHLIIRELGDFKKKMLPGYVLRTIQHTDLQ